MAELFEPDGSTAIGRFLITACTQDKSLSLALDADVEAMRILSAGPEVRAEAERDFCRATKVANEDWSASCTSVR